MKTHGAPDAGDLVWVDFDDPPFGHERAGRRPALVLSDRTYNETSSFVLLCPITRRSRDWPFQVPLDATGIAGEAIVDQVKSVDRRRIVSPPLDRISDERLQTARAILGAILGLIPSGA
jgi:mRNA interferase MazF